MNTKCPICGSDSPFFISGQGYDFNKCVNCGLFFVNPMPTDLELLKIYSPEANYQSNKIKKDYRKDVNYKYIKIFNKLKKYQKPGQKVLDVGASDGDFLYYAKNNGYEVFGVEPNKTTADIANKNGLNVHYGFLSDSNFSKNSFDFLRLGDVLEHSNNPYKLINECKSFIKIGGLIIVSIPNMDSFWVKSTCFFNKVFKLPWSVLEPPHHLLYFSKSNLDLFLKDAGFDLVTFWYHRPPTLKYELGNTHLLGKFKRERNIKNLFLLVLGFSLYSILYFVDYLITPFKNKDYSMLCIYRKND